MIPYHSIFPTDERYSPVRMPVSLEARVKIVDCYAEHPTVRMYQPDTLRITALIQSARLKNIPEQDTSFFTGQKVVLTMPYKKKSDLKKLTLGQILWCRGVYQELSGPGTPDYFYSRYLKSIGISGTYKILAWKKQQRIAGFSENCSRQIQSIREKTAGRLLKHMVPLSAQSRMLLALSLGYGNVLEPHIKQSFIRSGTIHIFAISGLHVGLFFTILYLLLQKCGLPIQFRILPAALLTACYVCLTGITPSSVRALGMALLLLYAQLRHRLPLPLNALGLTGLIAIHDNPALLQNIGFLFSYTVVFFLLSTIPLMQDLQNILKEKRKWLPAGHQPAMGGVKIICSIISCLTAWTAGLGITMHMNGIFCIFSPLINLLLLPLIPVCLILIPVKILLGCLWTAGEIYCSSAISSILKYMLMTAEWGSRLPGIIFSGNQPPASILFFYLGCVILLLGHPGSVLISLLYQWKEHSEDRQESKESH